MQTHIGPTTTVTIRVTIALASQRIGADGYTVQNNRHGALWTDTGQCHPHTRTSTRDPRTTTQGSSRL